MYSNGSDVHGLVERAVEAAAARTGTFAPRRAKAVPRRMVDGLGWCTWDAFYSSVSAKKVEAGLEALGAAGVKCRRLIIDDGWMALDRDTDDALNLSGEILTAANSAGNAAEKMYDGPAARAQRKFAELVGAAYARYVERAPPNSAGVLLWRLAATTVLRAPLCHFFDESTDFTKALAWPPRPHAAKFGGEAGLAAFVRDVAKGTHGVDHVACWHASAGYWGGAATPAASRVRARATPHLAAADAQSGVGALGGGRGGGPEAARLFVEAMEGAGAAHFGDGGAVAVSNCMCHCTEQLYRYASTALARASDDFYPREAPSWRWHLTACAYNSLLLSPIVLPDWDMFQSDHPAAWLHAAARANSGGPVTVSDKPGAHDDAVLRALALPDGATLVATAPARVGASALFATPRDGAEPPRARAPNGDDGAVVGLYNVQGSAWSWDERRFVAGDAAPVDAARCATLRRVKRDDGAPRLRLRAKTSRSSAGPAPRRRPGLDPGAFELYAVRRVLATPAGAEVRRRLSAMLNGRRRRGAAAVDGEAADVAALGPGAFAARPRSRGPRRRRRCRCLRDAARAPHRRPRPGDHAPRRLGLVSRGWRSAASRVETAGSRGFARGPH
ncbi:galactinol-sucrose galactosyltransferase [Aureococcus anophagefferens]|nr:galactinol-sucrose galactosyltransferase [Aureococcus anophagefferens]